LATATVVICTYNRPDMLSRAVASVRAQFLRPGHAAEILVVDNSRDANAEAAVAALAVGYGLTLRYKSLPRPNVSHARNAGVAEAPSDYVVFLDDDEWVEPGWLDAMIDTAERTGADLVFGAVLPVFPDGTPAWDPSGRSLERRMALPSGSFISIHQPDRKA
jgi:succinoglycan biosynthesis protein ExoM